MRSLQTLSDLLADLFSGPELLDWMRRLPDGAHLPRELADRAPATLAFDAEVVLSRHGYLDAALFDALVAARPRRAADIRAVQRLVLGSAPEVSAAPAAPAHLPVSSVGPIPNVGPSHQGQGNTQIIQSAAGGMIFNGAVTVTGGHLGPVHHLGPGRASAAPPIVARPPTGTDPKLQDLRALIAKRQVVVIVGAAASVAATGGVAKGWKGLIGAGVERCRELGLGDERWGRLRLQLLDEGEVADWIHVAEQVTAKLGGARGGEYRRWLRETVGSLKVTDTRLLQAVADLGCPIATTNYDHLLSDITGLPAVSWDDAGEVERALRRDDPGVLHLHGHWKRPESVVFGTSSYLGVRDDPHADAIRKALRTFNSLLFVGCGDTTQDPNLGAFLAWSGQVFAGSEYRSYRLELDADVARVQAQHPPEQRLFALGVGPDHSALPGYLRGLVP